MDEVFGGYAKVEGGKGTDVVVVQQGHVNGAQHRVVLPLVCATL